MKNRETAKRLTDAMNNKNIQAAELARLSGVSKASISQYMNGRNVPSNKNAYALGKILCVQPSWLMGFDVTDYVVLPDNKDVDFDIVIEQNNNQAFDLYNRYLAADSKTRKMIDFLLNGEDNEN